MADEVRGMTIEEWNELQAGDLICTLNGDGTARVAAITLDGLGVWEVELVTGTKLRASSKCFWRVYRKAAPSDAVRVEQLTAQLRDANQRISELEERVSVLVASRDHQRVAAKTARKLLREAVGYLQPIVLEFNVPLRCDDSRWWVGSVTCGHMRSARAFLASLDAGEDAPSCPCGAPGEAASAMEGTDTTEGANEDPAATNDFTPDATFGHWCDECKAGCTAHSRKVQDGRHLCPEHFAEWAENEINRLTRIILGPDIRMEERDEAIRERDEARRKASELRKSNNDAQYTLIRQRDDAIHELIVVKSELATMRTHRDTLMAQRDEALAAWGEDARFLDAVRRDLRQCRAILGETQEALRKKCDQLDAVRSQRDKAVAASKMMLAWHKCEPGTFREAAMRVVSTLRERAARYGDTFGALGVRDALHDIASHVRSKASRIIIGDGSADADQLLDIAGYGILGMVRLAQEGGE